MIPRNSIDTAYPVDPMGSGSCRAGIIIDGVIYSLEGEPAACPITVHHS